jgi:hypothetical protein
MGSFLYISPCDVKVDGMNMQIGSQRQIPNALPHLM